MLTAIIDYESGNLHSAEKAFQRMAREVNAGEVVVTSDADVVARADRVVLPGDGAFPACAAELRGHKGLFEALREAVEHGGKIVPAVFHGHLLSPGSNAATNHGLITIVENAGVILRCFSEILTIPS